MHTATLYREIGQGKLQCLACKLKCVIKPGEVGVCGVRENRDGKMYLLVYGRASAVNIDPMEKKPLYHFLPGREVFSLGTVGCNFACTFCQNWDISQATRHFKAGLKKDKSLADVELEVGAYGYELSPERIVKICEEKAVPCIAYTYNEPVIFFEYLYDTSVLAHAKGIRNIFVSNGYESEEALSMMQPYLSAMNIDLKSFSDEFYKKICKARLAPVLDTIREAHRLGIWVEITTLIIPGLNDSDEELKEIADFIASVSPDIPWHVTAFHPDYQMRDRGATPPATLYRAFDVGKERGLNYVYVGNIPDRERSNTHCPECGFLLVRRNGYRISVSPAFQGGVCPNCQTKIPGVWE